MTPPMDRDELIARQFERIKSVERALANGAYYADDPECHPAYPTLIAARQIIEEELNRIRLSRPAPTEERYRHKKRGTCYTVIGEGRGQGVISDEDQVTIYRGDDGKLWVRRSFEFHDGRFERLATDTTPSRAPTEERQVASHVDDELTRSFIDGWNARLDYTDFDLALHFWMRDGAGIPAASLPRAQAFTPSRDEEGSVDRDERFWLVLQEPGLKPERKGPWRRGEQVTILREFIAARPTAYIHVLTMDYDGSPWVDHGPEVLQMLDGRSMGTGRKHNQRTREAHAPHHAALKTSTPETQTVEGGEHAQ